MNELIFFGHIGLVVGFALAALRLGRGALTAFIALSGVLANLFVLKQMSLFGLWVTCSDVFVVGAILGLNLLQEYFGKEKAQEAVKISLCALLFFACMAQVHLLYLPAHGAYEAVLASNARITLASLATTFVVQRVDVRVFGLLRGAFAVRVAISLVLSQALDTVLFSYLGLYGLVNGMGSIMLFSFLVKCLVAAGAMPFVVLTKRMVKHVPF